MLFWHGSNPSPSLVTGIRKQSKASLKSRKILVHICRSKILPTEKITRHLKTLSLKTTFSCIFSTFSHSFCLKISGKNWWFVFLWKNSMDLTLLSQPFEPFFFGGGRINRPCRLDLTTRFRSEPLNVKACFPFGAICREKTLAD